MLGQHPVGPTINNFAHSIKLAVETPMLLRDQILDLFTTSQVNIERHHSHHNHNITIGKAIKKKHIF